MATTFGATPIPAQTEVLDPKVKALASAIIQKESGGNYQAKGASGEYGAYQFMPDTWGSWAAKHLGDAKAPMTVENQNKVAYNQIKEWKDQGLTPAQIASKWNSGKENAYKENYRGVNKFGVAYDVPKYVADVSSIYKQKVAGVKEATPATPVPAPVSARKAEDIASAEKYKPWAPANTEQPSAFGEATKVVANVLPSAWNFVKGLVKGITETPKTIANLPGEIKGLMEETKQRDLLTPEARAKAKTLLGQEAPVVPGALEQVASAAPKATYETLVPEAARGYVTAAGGAITGNEGKIDEGLQIAQRAIVNDPVGQIMPFIIAARAAAGKAGYGAEFDAGVSKMAAPVTKTASTVFGKVTAPIKTAAEFTGRQLTGLNKETVKAFAEDPTLKTVTPEGLIGKKENLGAQVQEALAKQKAELGISNETLGKEVQRAFTKRTESLKQTGEAYAPVREFNKPVTVSPNWLENTISELTGLKFKKGQLQTSSNAVLRDASDVRAFQHLYDLYKPAFKKGTISTTEFLNFREDMANLSKFDRQIGKSRPVEDIAKIMRGKFNTEYRPQLKGLENLDKEFGKQTVEMRTLAKGLLDKSGNLTDAGLSKIVKLSETKPTLMAQLEQISPGITARIKSLQALNELGKGLIDNNGNITDAGMRKIVNAGNEANPQMLARLEEIKPGITKGIQQYKALQDAQVAIEKHKVGTYARNIGIAGLGGGLLTMNPALIAGAIVEMILTSPENAITIIQTYAKTKAIATSLSNKIERGKQQIINTLNTDVKDLNIKAGLSIEDVTRKPSAFSPKIKGEATTPEKTNLIQEAKKYKSADEFIKSQGTPIYRAGEPRAKPMSESTFYTPKKEATAEYNLSGKAKVYENVVNESKLFKGESSLQYAIDNNLMDKPMSPELQKLTGFKTLREVDNSYAEGVGKNASKAYQENPNIFYTAFQQMVAKELKAKGFSGARWSYEDDLTPIQYQIWDNSIVKDKSQLTDTWNKANTGAKIDSSAIDQYLPKSIAPNDVVKAYQFGSSVKGKNPKDYDIAIILPDNHPLFKKFKDGMATSIIKKGKTEVHAFSESMEDVFLNEIAPYDKNTGGKYRGGEMVKEIKLNKQNVNKKTNFGK